MNENELYHYGVKGQKWGVRRTAAQLGHKPTTKKKKVSKGEEFMNRLSTARKNRAANQLKKEKQRTRQAEQKAKLTAQKEATKKAKAEAKAIRKGATVKKTNKVDISQMSDEDLRKIVNRLQLEQQYRQLNPRKVSVGEKFLKKVANDVVIPAAVNSGRNLLQENLTKAGRKISK